ncbi:MAG: signal peptide peptidase SppA [Leptospiraceae bacterium]|nr:signal peptide peptidase SppA [Leptospiraceae bacterium]MDW8305443.1 signal peptide peptidase SppA [Leptospiraceae bacterium]
MKKNKICLSALLLLTQQIFSEPPPDTLQAERLIKEPNLPRDSVATSDDITSLYFNPAGLGFHPLQIGYFYGHNEKAQIFDHTLFLNVLGFAFSSQWRIAPLGNFARHYTLGTGILNTRLFSMGTSYSWYQSSQPYLNRYTQWDIGFLLRPFRYLSLGAVARAINEPILLEKRADPYWDFGVALRPWPKNSERLTVAVDTSWAHGQSLRSLTPRFLVELLPTDGLTLYGGWDVFQNIFLGSKFALEVSQLSLQANIPRTGGNFYSGGVLLGRERFLSGLSPLGRWLRLSLDTDFQEFRKEGFLFEKDIISFYDILEALRRAQEDGQIRGLILTGRNFKGGWAQAEELRKALGEFAEKKPVYAFLQSATNKEYYIATAAEKIVMPPGGYLELNGLRLESYYLKDLFTKIGIEADFITIGRYKSAGEIFTRNTPSSFDREQKEKLLQDFSTVVKKAILDARQGLSEKDLDDLMHRGLFTSQQAKENGFIDEIAYLDEFEEYLSSHARIGGHWQVDLRNYVETLFYDDSWGPKPEVAILIIDGEIVAGYGEKNGLLRERTVGSEEITEICEKLREDRNVKAVVVRINSPGGSGMASDLIWRQVRHLAEEKKSVIVSLGDIAASGGYYIAVGGDKILANELTVTGSVGVIGGKFSLKKLYEWLGVNKYTWRSHKNAAIFTENESFTQEERALLQQQLTGFYELFLERVERSRQLGMARLQENAEGRIFSGREAKSRKMADDVGGLLLATELAIQQAGLSSDYVEINVYPEHKAKIPGLGKNNEPALPFFIRQAIRLTRKAENLEDERVLMLMPYDITIQ